MKNKEQRKYIREALRLVNLTKQDENYSKGRFDAIVEMLKLSDEVVEKLPIGFISNRFDSKYTPPFRVGRKQGKAVLDANGIEVVFFKNSEEQARKYCDYLNGA